MSELFAECEWILKSQSLYMKKESPPTPTPTDEFHICSHLLSSDFLFKKIVGINNLQVIVRHSNFFSNRLSGCNKLLFVWIFPLGQKGQGHYLFTWQWLTGVHTRAPEIMVLK